MSRPNTSQPRHGMIHNSSLPGPRRNPGTVPGLARTASSLRKGTLPAQASSLSSLPAHLRNLSAPHIPSPLGKGTPARGLKQSLPARTSKTTERHVLLPEDPQLAPFPKSPSHPSSLSSTPPRRDSMSGPSRERQQHIYQDERSDAERMNKREREGNNFPRLTAYATAEGYKLKLLQAFLKREHGVSVLRVYDDCVYAVYHLPLLPGYGATTKVRSSPVLKPPTGPSLMERMTLAEEQGYNDTYFPRDPQEPAPTDYILATSPGRVEVGATDLDAFVQDGEGERKRREEARERSEVWAEGKEQGQGAEEYTSVINPSSPEERSQSYEHAKHSEPKQLGTHMSAEHPGYIEHTPSTALVPNDLQPVEPSEYPFSSNHQLAVHHEGQKYIHSQLLHRRKSHGALGNIAEAIFFNYGVSVFFGFKEIQEREIMEDCETVGAWTGGLGEDDWEAEEFHYVFDPDAENPRVNNDMFTFKSRSHLFKLSLAHAIAQSTKLSIYESVMQETLSLTVSFPKELSITGHLQLTRREALKLTGRLFKLRMDVNLSGGILDTPELFWSEASLFPLYEAIHEYLEIGPRVQVLNDRLSVAGDLLEIIHEYIEERATHRITWIIIWLIVVACFVEFGEVIARLIFHAIPRDEGEYMLLKAPRLLLKLAT
ncbi:hypothetical protein L204_103133 [Cryptococcus depauperatus]|nr:cytoplasmic protein [Cryptococcus depauperatus CBS 7855]